jgi:hypothetical protein
MESRGKRWWWLVAAAGVLTATALGAVAFLAVDRRPPPDNTLTEVVVSTQDISANERLDPLVDRGVFRVISVPSYSVVEGAVTSVEELIGLAPTTPILSNEQIPSARLSWWDRSTSLPEYVRAAVGTWYNADGYGMPDSRPFAMTILSGAQHCGWDGILFLETTWPLGEIVRRMSIGDTLTFGRIPGNPKVGIEFATSFQPDTELPPAAYDTGYHRDRWHLWVVDDRIRQAVWMVHGDTVERWPAATNPVLCA